MKVGASHGLTHTAPTDLTVAAALVRKAYSKRRRSRLWPKPVNLRTWGLISDPMVMVQVFAEHRYGVVWLTRAKQAQTQCEIWAQFQPNPDQPPYSLQEIIDLCGRESTRQCVRDCCEIVVIILYSLYLLMHTCITKPIY